MTGMTNVTKLASEPSGQEFLVFTLGDEEYGIDILKVQEIRGYDQVTRIANTPAFIKGVTNLRGVIVPIVDLRIKFSQVDVDYNDNTVVIVLNLGQRVVGIVVDGVSDVLSLTAEQIRPAPEFAVTLSTEYLTGLGALGDRMLILVNIEKLLNSEEMALLDSAASSGVILPISSIEMNPMICASGFYFNFAAGGISNKVSPSLPITRSTCFQEGAL